MIMELHGRIVKEISGFYYVQSSEGLFECRARGLFRKENIKPRVGDFVDFVSEDNTRGFIKNITPRKNELLRPRVSNIDILFIVISASYPKPDYMLCDKLIISAIHNHIKPVICVNKIDECASEMLEDVRDSYKSLPVIMISAKTGKGLEELKRHAYGKTFALAGQSAVGKSSIINAIDQTMSLEVGEISRKSKRGKHTTRFAELIKIEEWNAYIIDTPGFSSFELLNIEPNDLKLYYSDFMLYNHLCEYSSCLHLCEPICGVKKAVEKGFINKERYERYKRLMAILQETKERKS